MLPILAKLSGSRGTRQNLTELAEAMGKSPSYFQRAFSRLIGESPKQFSRRLQLEWAAVQLLITKDSVLQVALAVGFESHEGFTRAFTGHFGLSPKEYRVKGIVAGLSNNLSHTDLVTGVGPCVRLFRKPLIHLKKSENTSMPYEIAKQAIPETTFLYKSARCPHSDIADTLAQILPAIFQYATNTGIEMVGPPMTLYVEWGPGMVTLHAGMPVKTGAVGKEDVQVEVLPEGMAAVTIHTGPYEQLMDAHAAVEVFIAHNELKAKGPLREIYLTDPGEVPDPKDWKTQVVWPVES